MDALRRLRGQRGLPELARQVLEAVRDGLAVHDPDGRLVAWSAGARTITGWSREQAAGRFPRGLPDGRAELPGGRVVEARRSTLHCHGRRWTATLFSATVEGDTAARATAARHAAGGPARRRAPDPGEATREWPVPALWQAEALRREAEALRREAKAHIKTVQIRLAAGHLPREMVQD